MTVETSRVAIAMLALTIAGCTVRSTPADASTPSDARPAVIDASRDAALDAPSFDAGPPPPVVFIEPGAPIDSPDRFDGAARTELAPSIAYPIDGVLLPPNLGGLEIHFAHAEHDLFELRFAQGGVPRLIVYDDCDVRGDGCALALTDAMWAVLEADRGRGPYEVRVRGIGAAGAAIGESEPIEIELAGESVSGGLYFWSTEPAAIHRYDFDRGSRESEIFYDASDSGGRCVGCHVLSRDGRTIAIGYGTEGPIAMVDVATRAEARLVAAQMAAFSPDAMEIVTGGIPAHGETAPMQIVRTDGTGDPIDLGSGAAPDWSPDGDAIVFTDVESALRLFERSAGAWIARTEPVTPGGPDAIDHFGAFAPDSAWLAFSRTTPSTGPGGVETRVWALGPDGIERPLTRASAGAIDSMPRWNPSIFLERGRRLFWLTFTSNMPYGVDPHDARRRQIWMAAFDPSGDDADPSRPAFRLPGQPTTGSSFIPQWTTAVLRQPCEDTSDCRTGEMCTDGVCIPEII